MQYLKRNFTLFLIFLLAILLLLYMTYSLPPTYTFLFGSFKIPILIPFFFLLFCTLTGFIGYILKSKTQGVLAGLLFISYLLLRYFGFLHWFFLVLLFVIFILIEIIVLKSQ